MTKSLLSSPGSRASRPTSNSVIFYISINVWRHVSLLFYALSILVTPPSSTHLTAASTNPSLFYSIIIRLSSRRQLENVRCMMDTEDLIDEWLSPLFLQMSLASQVTSLQHEKLLITANVKRFSSGCRKLNTTSHLAQITIAILYTLNHHVLQHFIIYLRLWFYMGTLIYILLRIWLFEKRHLPCHTLYFNTGCLPISLQDWYIHFHEFQSFSATLSYPIFPDLAFVIESYAHEIFCTRTLLHLSGQYIQILHVLDTQHVCFQQALVPFPLAWFTIGKYFQIAIFQYFLPLRLAFLFLEAEPFVCDPRNMHRDLFCLLCSKTNSTSLHRT